MTAPGLSNPPRYFASPEFRRKVGYLFLGLAIGFVMLGFFQRHRAAEAAERERAREQAPKSSPLFPPPPEETPPPARTP
ncbi:MAG TPA: hypothetical protein VD971_07860 [Phycisphaerales bacterium]|nr:hypothetical protein [Phycisphaerales bacterium]